jgi:hypothetical protein
MSFVQYGYHQTEAQRAAEERQRDAMELVKEISQHQAVIIGQLEQLIRGGPPEGILQRIAEEGVEYGVRLEAILKLMGCEQRRITKR